VLCYQCALQATCGVSSLTWFAPNIIHASASGDATYTSFSLLQPCLFALQHA